MKNGLSTALLIIAFLIGLSLLLYPTVANYWNEHYTTKAVNEYVHTVEEMSEEDCQKYWEQAKAYNAQLYESGNGSSYNSSNYDEYMECLNPDNSGIMGYIEIPMIDVYLPIFHTTSNAVLQKAIGHLEWTSLPTGGENTHCVLSGHRGLPSAKLFTNLDELNVGDIFTITVLDELLTYEIDQILTVLPNETNEITIVPNEDYCTLVTCTPYGVNTHRLLVRGHRIENIQGSSVHITATAIQIEPVIVAPIIAAPLLIILMVWLTVSDRKKKRS